MTDKKGIATCGKCGKELDLEHFLEDTKSHKCKPWKKFFYDQYTFASVLVALALYGSALAYTPWILLGFLFLPLVNRTIVRWFR